MCSKKIILFFIFFYLFITNLFSYSIFIDTDIQSSHWIAEPAAPEDTTLYFPSNVFRVRLYFDTMGLNGATGLDYIFTYIDIISFCTTITIFSHYTLPPNGETLPYVDTGWFYMKDTLTIRLYRGDGSTYSEFGYACTGILMTLLPAIIIDTKPVNKPDSIIFVSDTIIYTNASTIDLSGTTVYADSDPSCTMTTITLYCDTDGISTNYFDTKSGTIYYYSGFASDTYDTWTGQINLSPTGETNIVVARVLKWYGAGFNDFYSDTFRCGYDTIFVYSFPDSHLDIKVDSVINSIFVPPDTFYTISQNVTISGTATSVFNGDTIYLFKNGSLINTYPVSMNLGDTFETFSFSDISISTKYNTFSVFVHTKFNSFDTHTIFVVYFDSPLIEIKTPANNTETIYNQITITGTTLNTTIGDSIFILNNNDTKSTLYVSANDTSWSAIVNLENYGNRIEVKIKDKWGRIDTDVINCTYLPQGIIGISSPANNTDTNLALVYLSGTTYLSSTGDSVKIYINDTNPASLQYTTALTANSGTWQGTALLSGYGQRIIVLLTDKYNRISSDSIRVNYYGQPSIEITAPADGHNTSAQIIWISGTTYNSKTGDSVEIYRGSIINSVATITGDSGSFSGTVLLNGVGDSVWVKLNGFSGTAYDTIRVNYYGQPSIEITAPADGHNTSVQIIWISGTTYNSKTGDSVEIYRGSTINSVVTITSDSGNFSGTVLLNSIGDSVWVKFSDNFGRTAYDTITVNYYGPPSIEITTPSDGHNTTVQQITISGTTANSKSGDTVA
ncbi:MAG TPA: hypothetical protein PKX90_12365, partial [bacterium]|nr:hypothetical protein [bacterium]